MILVFGSINIDLVTRVDRIARPGETVLSPDYELFHGGKGGNQAVAAARSAPGVASVAMCGAIGDDPFGTDARDNLSREGIDISLLQVVDARTGSAFISVDASGENAITVASGANRLLVADRLPDELLDRVGAAVLQMEVPLAENMALAERLHARPASVILNFAPARDDIPAETLRQFLGTVDHLVVNEHEAETLCAALGLGFAGDGGAALADSLGLAVIVTLGAAGVNLHRRGVAPWHRDADQVAVVDTTGAGDTFVGVLASGLDAGLSLEATIVRASAAASLSCTARGAQGGMPRLTDLARAI